MKAYYQDEAKVLSGGMSLVPLLKLRFASPGTIIDINNIEGLDYIEEAGGYLRVGALARNRALVRSELCRQRHPLMSSAAPTISDPVVRNRGTLVGNVCHSDPQGDWVTVMMCLGGEVVARSVDGERVIPIEQFTTGPFTNTLQANEVAVEVRIPGATNFGEYHKIERKVGDFATVAVGVALQVTGGSVSYCGIGLTGVGPSNIKCYDAERAVMGGSLSESTIAAAANAAAAASSPRSDHRGSEEYKREMVAVFVRRSLNAAAGNRAA
jgi:carbon-monoxide dehydrogenase medium subunit